MYGGLLSLIVEDGCSSWSFSDPLFKVCQIAGKGVGIVACAQLQPGTRLIAEQPLARLPMHWASRAQAAVTLDKVIGALSPESRADYFSLSQGDNHGTVQTSLGVWLTNALPLDDARGSDDKAADDEAAVFTKISRLNHSCVPCCHQEWNAELGLMTVHVIRPVEAGEELTICYLTPAGRPRTERLGLLRNRFGFDCDCTLCTLRDDRLLHASDVAQRAIGNLQLSAEDEQGLRLAAEGTASMSSSSAVIEEKLRLLAREGMPIIWGRPLMLAAAMQSSAAGRHDLAVKWLETATEMVRDACGEDAPGFAEVADLMAVVRQMAMLTAL